jgi:hypothetical protein
MSSPELTPTHLPWADRLYPPRQGLGFDLLLAPSPHIKMAIIQDVYLLCRTENIDEEQSTGPIAVQSERPEAEARVPVHPQITSPRFYQWGSGSALGHPDPHVFGHPGSGSFIQRYGSRSFPFLIKVLSGLK